MPLSSVVGAQSIVKPGVCTSSTRPASPYDGQVIYETDTDRTLVYNGSAWVFLSTSRANPGGLDLVKTQTIGSAVSSVTVSDVFSATYDNYRIIVSGGAASATPNLNMILGSTTSGYYYGSVYSLFSSSTQNGEAGSNQASWLRVAVGSSTGLNGVIEVFSPFESSRTAANWVTSHQYTTGLVSRGSGFLDNATSYTAFTLTPNSGTLTGGTIAVYGYAK
jgi:hypothetical protein